MDSNERLRLASLCKLAILDTPSEERFDRYTAIAAAAFSVPVALVSLVDAERQWFKSHHGLQVRETPRSMAFCSHAITSPSTFVVGDTLLDARFADNPLVTGAPHIRFYAGHPICSEDGHAVGTLCIIDSAPRQLDAAARAMLASLAAMVEAELNKNALIEARAGAERALQLLNAGLEQRIAERTLALEEKNEALSREIRQRNAIEATLRSSEERVRTMIDSALSAFVATDAAGAIIEWNPAAEQMFGWPRADVIGQPLVTTVIAPRHRADHAAAMARVSAHGIGTLGEGLLQLPVASRSGKEFTVEMAVNSFTVDGQAYFGAFLHDISERLEASRALEQKQELLDAVLETVDVGVIACDADGSLSFFNRAAREFHGQAAARMDAGEWAEHYDLYEADGITRLASYDIPLLRALAGESVKDAKMIIAPRGMRRRTVLSSGRRLVARSGERLGAVVAMKDITELNEWQEKLRANEHRLRAITENLPTMIGQIDRAGRFVFLNTRATRYYRQPAGKLLGQHVREAYSPEDYAFLAPYIELAMSGTKTSFEGETSIDGKRHFYHASYVPNLDETGAPNGFYAMAFDITTRRHSELLKAESEDRLRTITNNVPVLIAYLDRELRYRFANAMYKEWMGVRSDDMTGRSVSEVFGEDYYRERESSLKMALAGHMTSIESSVHRKGRARVLSSTYIPHVRDGVTVGIYVLSTDATASREHERHLLLLANADPLTALPNRRMYEEHLKTALARARRHRSGLALMYLDLDNFKHINDTLGHRAGDEVLVGFGQRIKAVLRDCDLLARLAGDEFTIVLEEVDSRDACALVADKILAVLKEPFHVDGQALTVSASIGIALAGHGASADALGNRADAALYAAKRAGKNRFSVFAEAPVICAAGLG